MPRLIPNPTDVFRKVDGVVAHVEDVLAQVDSTLASVDETLSAATAVLTDVRDALGELHQELHNLRRIPAFEAELAELHQLVKAIAAAVVTPKRQAAVTTRA